MGNRTFTTLTFIEVKITHRFILILLLANVIVLELINTAIETTIDLVTRRYSYRAKLAKDMASGAVLIASLVLLGFSIFIYWPAMYNFFKGVLIGS